MASSPTIMRMATARPTMHLNVNFNTNEDLPSTQ